MDSSTANSVASTQNSPEPESLHDKATRKWVGLRLLENMVFQRDQKNLLDDSRKTVNWWNRFNMAGKDGANALPTGGDDMGDMIAGDQKIIHHHYPPAKSALGTVAKLALGGALLASGVGAGFAVPILWSALKPKPATVIQQGDTDTDTTTMLRRWQPKGK